MNINTSDASEDTVQFLKYNEIPKLTQSSAELLRQFRWHLSASLNRFCKTF